MDCKEELAASQWSTHQFITCDLPVFLSPTKAFHAQVRDKKPLFLCRASTSIWQSIQSTFCLSGSVSQGSQRHSKWTRASQETNCQHTGSTSYCSCPLHLLDHGDAQSTTLTEEHDAQDWSPEKSDGKLVVERLLKHKARALNVGKDGRTSLLRHDSISCQTRGSMSYWNFRLRYTKQSCNLFNRPYVKKHQEYSLSIPGSQVIFGFHTIYEVWFFNCLGQGSWCTPDNGSITILGIDQCFIWFHFQTVICLEGNPRSSGVNYKSEGVQHLLNTYSTSVEMFYTKKDWREANRKLEKRRQRKISVLLCLVIPAGMGSARLITWPSPLKCCLQRYEPSCIVTESSPLHQNDIWRTCPVSAA